MDKLALDSLAQFCAEQAGPFDPEVWTDRAAIDGKGLAVVAKYLSMTSWYGYEEQLECIAASIDTGVSELAGFQRQVLAIGLDLTRFSALVRRAIALRHRDGRAAQPKQLTVHGLYQSL